MNVGMEEGSEPVPDPIFSLVPWTGLEHKSHTQGIFSNACCVRRKLSLLGSVMEGLLGGMALQI